MLSKMNNQKIAAGIVLYNPEIVRLRKNIEGIYNQVEKIYIFDNGSKNNNEICQLLNRYEDNKIDFINYNNNQGLAFALNIIVLKSAEDGFDWILTLDQDSICDSSIIETFMKYIYISDVGIICPVYYDSRRKNLDLIVKQQKTRDIDFCITSGSLTNIDIYKKIGGFDETLFIGLIDNEYCYKLRLAGYRIIEDASVIMNHELGNLTASKHEKLYLKLGDLLHSNTIKKLSYKREVNPMRFYYSTRNMIYLNRKYYKNLNSIWSTKTFIKNTIADFIRGKNKIILVKKFVLGVKDGLKLPAS